MGEGPVQQKALIGPEDTTRFTGGFDGAAQDRSPQKGRRKTFGRSNSAGIARTLPMTEQACVRSFSAVLLFWIVEGKNKKRRF